ncbi:MAG: MFS transporter [Pseudomonadota bacterium]
MSTLSRSPAMQALRHPDFARYAFGRLAGTLAWQMVDVVILVQVWHLTRDYLSLGLVGLAQFLPFFVLLLPGGQIADRFDRRLIIACAFSIELAGAIMLLAFTLLGGTNVYICFLAAALLGVARAFWAPAGQAMTPNLVPKNLLPGAISVNTVLFQAGVIAGPIVGGALLKAGYHFAYGMAVALLTTTVLLMAGVRPVRAQAVAEWRWHSVLDGFRFVWRKKPLLGAISLDLFAVLFGGAVALLPVFAERVLHVDSLGLGFLRAAPAVGAGVVALTLGVRPIQKAAGRWMFGGVALFGVCTVIFGLSTSFWLSLTVLALAGAGDMVSVFVRQLLVQLETPDAIRGRVSAVNSMFIGASNELGAFESGLTASWFGAIRSVVFGGLGTLFVVASYMRLFPELRKLDRFPEAVH